ncbi:MAG TPA: hypothetical protein VGN14_15910 [Candidatus Elarobacter sp.]
MRIVLARWLTVAVFCLIPVAARADDASDLVAKNLAARGGADKLAAITSLQFTGKLIVPGNYELSYKETRSRKHGATLIQSTIQGLTLVQGYDGNVGWRINPFEGRRDAERMSADETGALADDATIDGALLSAKAQGSAVSYLGREDFEGTNAYKLRVVLPSGAQYMYYLDPDTYLEIKVVETRLIRGARQVTQTSFGDYERVGGVYFPFDIESGPPDSVPAQHQKVIISAAKANVDAPDAMFAMPPAPSATK